ncbi:MAG: Gfo/Idh/MocA family oxidoreductase [Bdellovibrionota bacterium]
MIKTAVVGVGYLGSFHAEKYQRSDKAELCAVVDISKEQAEKVASRLGTKALSDYRELPALGVQCASISADTMAHFEISSWLLSHGVDVLVEKPIATSSAQARELIDIARQNGRILQVGHLERFNPAFRAMQKLLTRPRFFEARRISPFAGRGHDVDVVLDLMIHDIDIIAHLVGRPLLKVDAVGVPVLTKNVDIANARLTFEGGAVANVTASRVSFKSERSVRIFQPDVYISLDYGNKKLKMYTKSGAVEPGKMPQIAVEEHNVEERDALFDQIESFLDCVATRTPPAVSGVDGLRALELADRIRAAFQESSESFNADELVLQAAAGFDMELGNQ